MAFDRKSVLRDIAELGATANEHGLIEAYGLYLSRLPSELWRGFGRSVLEAVPPELWDAAWHALFGAARECGYHTGWDLMRSEPWATLVRPRIKKAPEDVVHGLLAVFTAWGWGKAEAVELSAERMVVRAYDYYESDGAASGWQDRLQAPYLCGVATACYELAFGGPYPEGLGRAVGQQVRGIECGDDYGEFVITRVA